MTQPKDLLVYLEKGDRSDEHLKEIYASVTTFPEQNLNLGLNQNLANISQMFAQQFATSALSTMAGPVFSNLIQRGKQ